MVTIVYSLSFVKRCFRVYELSQGAAVLSETKWRGTAARSARSLWRSHADTRPDMSNELYGLFSIEAYHEDFAEAITDLCMISHNTLLLKKHALEQALVHGHPVQFIVKQVTFVDDQSRSIFINSTANYQLSCIYGGKYGCHSELLAQLIGAPKNTNASNVLELDYFYEDGAINA